MSSAQELALMAVIVWCILELWKARSLKRQFSPMCVLIFVSRDPQLLEGLTRYLVWESQMAMSYELRILLDPDSLDHETAEVFDILCRWQLVEAMGDDIEPDLVFVI